MRNWLPRPWWLGPLRLLGALATVLALGCAAFAVDDAFVEQRMIAALQQGGHMIYLRHADRVRGPREKLTGQSSAADFADCRQQRNLTEHGRDQARRLGHAWRVLKIPVGAVIANAPCRVRDTALLAFGHVKIDQRLYDLAFLRQQLLQIPTDGTNTVIVSSDSTIRELTGVDLGFAEMAVIDRDGRGGVKVVAQLDLDDWEDAADPSWWDWF